MTHRAGANTKHAVRLVGFRQYVQCVILGLCGIPGKMHREVLLS